LGGVSARRNAQPPVQAEAGCARTTRHVSAFWPGG
jgi:hypothetical protein